MHIKIHRYEILDIDSDSYILSPIGLTKLVSRSMDAFLRDLLPRAEYVATNADLNELLKKHNLLNQSAQDFVKSALKITPMMEKPEITRLIISGDWEDTPRTEQILQKQTAVPIEVVPLEKLQFITKDERKTLIILASQRASLANLREIYSKLASMFYNGALCVGYFTSQDFILSQPYLPSFGNPCFFCEIDRCLHHESQTGGSAQWIKILKASTAHPIPFSRPCPGLLAETLAISLIANLIKFFCQQPDVPRLQDCALYSCSINLESGAMVKNINSHWPRCECLRRNQ